MKILITIFFLLFGSLYAADAIGKVVTIEGSALANVRQLSRGSEIFISDVIKVAEASKLQIRFTDGGLLNLIASTEYRIDSYQFAKTGTDNYSAKLVKGGFRTLTGGIAKSNPNNYSVQTPVLTIGIRGTLYSVNIVDGVVYVGVENGAISATNAGGTVVVGAGNYISTGSSQIMGEPTTVQPDALNPSIFTSPQGGINLETAREPTGLGTGIQIGFPESVGNPPCP